MKRFRRLRATPALRSLVRETTLSPSQLVYPIFVEEGENKVTPVPSLPGVSRWTLDRLPELLADVKASGIGGVLLFGIPARKDALATAAYDPEGVVQRAIRLIKAEAPKLVVIADVCLCEYTDHGHCGVVRDGKILNDETLPLLAKMAVSCAAAGVDMVAPSDMMDGRVAFLREALDEAGFSDTPIMAYSAKFASAYYGPFRDAAGSAPAFGDRRSHQMDPANGREALREIETDLDEGADIVMVKPALAYLDVLARARDRFGAPLAVYNVSGEYAMVKAAAAKGWIDEKRVVLENMTALRRAGAEILITYHALDVAKWLREGAAS